MKRLQLLLSVTFLIVTLPVSSTTCSSDRRSPTGDTNVETILQIHRKGLWDLDLSNLQEIPEDLNKFLLRMSEHLRVHEVPRPPAQDAYIYDILIDETNRCFWIHRRGGYVGVNEIHGVGILEPDGNIRYVEPSELGYRK